MTLFDTIFFAFFPIQTSFIISNIEDEGKRWSPNHHASLMRSTSGTRRGQEKFLLTSWSSSTIINIYNLTFLGRRWSRLENDEAIVSQSHGPLTPLHGGFLFSFIKKALKYLLSTNSQVGFFGVLQRKKVNKIQISRRANFKAGKEWNSIKRTLLHLDTWKKAKLFLLE